MTQDNKAINKMAQRVIEGYEAVHNKDFQRAKQLLEPISPLLHQEDKPNITFLCYLAISQIGSKDIDPFLDTYEELQKYEIKNNKEQALKDRVEEMFHELISAFQQTDQGE